MDEATGHIAAHIVVSRHVGVVPQYLVGGDVLGLPRFVIGIIDVELLVSNQERVQVRLRVVYAPQIPTYNVVGSIPGTSCEEIICMAHADSIILSEGVNDNTATAIITLMLAHACSGTRPHRTLTFLITGVVFPSIRYRNIYEMVVYKTKLAITGIFSPIDYAFLDIAAEDIMWDGPTLNVGITDLRGINEPVELNYHDQQKVFEPGSNETALISGISARLGWTGEILPEVGLSFVFDLAFEGSDSLQFVPLAKRRGLRWGLLGRTLVMAERSCLTPAPSMQMILLPIGRSST